ncbi:MAG: hypothetical protein RLY93_00490 [Sumerlaeia bacterium]
MRSIFPPNVPAFCCGLRVATIIVAIVVAPSGVLGSTLKDIQKAWAETFPQDANFSGLVLKKSAPLGKLDDSSEIYVVLSTEIRVNGDRLFYSSEMYQNEDPSTLIQKNVAAYDGEYTRGYGDPLTHPMSGAVRTGYTESSMDITEWHLFGPKTWNFRGYLWDLISVPGAFVEETADEGFKISFPNNPFMENNSYIVYASKTYPYLPTRLEVYVGPWEERLLICRVDNFSFHEVQGDRLWFASYKNTSVLGEVEATAVLKDFVWYDNAEENADFNIEFPIGTTVYYEETDHFEKIGDPVASALGADVVGGNRPGEFLDDLDLPSKGAATEQALEERSSPMPKPSPSALLPVERATGETPSPARSGNWPIFLIGLGLVALGVAAHFLLPKFQNGKK